MNKEIDYSEWIQQDGWYSPEFSCLVNGINPALIKLRYLSYENNGLTAEQCQIFEKTLRTVETWLIGAGTNIFQIYFYINKSLLVGMKIEPILFEFIKERFAI